MKKIDVEKLEAEVRGVMTRTVEAGQMLGGICQVNQDGKMVSRISVGTARLGMDEIVKENDIFRLASMTKNICGVTVLQMMDRNAITLDTEISKFFPGFKEKWIAKLDEKGNLVPDRKASVPITVKHLVTHTNGIMSADPVGTVMMTQTGGFIKNSFEKLQDGIDFYENEVMLSFEPGSMWAYSGMAGCDLISRMVEMVTDMPYDEYVKKYVTEPLEMPDTVFEPNEEQWNRLVTVLNKDEKGNFVDDPESVGRTIFAAPLSYHSGGVSMVSTLTDYMKLSETLRCNGIGWNGYRLLSKEQAARMGTPLTERGMKGMFFPSMQFGTLVNIRSGSVSLPDDCYGWGGAYGTLTWIDPVNKINVVYMRNSRLHANILDSSTGDMVFEKGIRDALYD